MRRSIPDNLTAMSLDEIAAELGIATYTVRNICQSAYAKLRRNTRLKKIHNEIRGRNHRDGNRERSR